MFFAEYKNNQPVEIPLFRTEEGRYLATCKFLYLILMKTPLTASSL